MRPEYVPIVALAAIPSTMVVVSQIAQGTSQTLNAIGVDGEEAAHRMSLILMASGVALTVAAAASSIEQRNPRLVLATGITAALVVWAYHRISIQGKPITSPFRASEEST